MEHLNQQFFNYLYANEQEKAITLCEQAIASNSNEIINYWYLGIAYLLGGEIETTQTTWMSVLLERDNWEQNTDSLINTLQQIGTNLLEENKLNLAQLIYEQIITWDEDNLDNYEILGYIYRDLGNNDQAELIFKHLIDAEPKNSNLYIEYSNLLLKQYRHHEIIDILQTAIKIFPQETKLYFSLVQILKLNGQAEQAIFYAEKILQSKKDNIIFALENTRILPILYKNESEINFYRQRFTNCLDEILDNLSLETESEKKIALDAISSNTNFYLQYQGKNDLVLQRKYGQLVETIIKANYPEIATQSFTKLRQTNSRIKVGLISAHFRDHNGANWSLGWIKLLNRNKFIVNCYYLENIEDEFTKKFQQYSDNFYICQGDSKAISAKIIEDNIEVLIYTDIGMNPQITKLAALKLAPIQCVTLGHPITSGLSTIDYYISRNLMEPENAVEHYTEKLVLLPNIGIHIEAPKLPHQPKERSELGLENNSIVYLCCQSLFKYLPQFDYIYPVIAQQVNLAKFVFIEFPISQFINQQFKQRLEKIFAEYNLNYQDYCVILPSLDEPGFMSLNLVANIFLDSFTWSGDNTARLAVACDLPVVSYPGEFMRGRHCYGILNMIDVKDTIANSESEYIDIAVKLGNNYQWRQEITNKIRANKHKLFNDLECIRGLEDFIINVVNTKEDYSSI